MKFKGSKKLLSLFLAVLMVVSSVPAFALSASAAVNSTDVSALETAMHSYEEKMKTGGIMTNMKAAYDAYVNAQKAIDAVKYGYSTSIDVSAVAANLTNATNNMNSYSVPTGNATAPKDNSYSKDSLLVDSSNGIEDKMSNVLYAAGVTDEAWSKDSVRQNTAKSLTIKFYTYFGGMQYGDMAFLWNGNDKDYANIICAFGNSDAKEGGFRKIIPTTDGFQIKSNWHMSNVAKEKNYSAKYWIFGEVGDRFFNFGKNDTRNNYYGYNTLYYTGTPTSTVTTVTDINYYCVFYSSYRSDYDNKSDGLDFGHTNTTGNSGNTTTDIYIVNIKPFADKIVNLQANFDVTKYKEGGLNSYLAKLDELTSFDPNSYFTNSNKSTISTDVKNCGNKIDEYTSAMDSMPSIVEDAKEYQDLRTAITNANTASTAKTAVSLVRYGKAISEARNVFASDVISYGYNSPDNAETKATALNDAKSALADVDTDDAYSNFDAAVTVVNAMDTDAFIDSNTVADKVASAKAQVYTTLTDSDDIEAYTLATGTAPTADLKNSASVDTFTKKLLDFANEPSADLIKDIAVTFGAQIQKDNNDPVTAGETNNTYKYGTMVTFDADSFDSVSALGDNKSIKWTVNYADNTISKFATNTTTITIKATKGMTVTANVIDETPNAEAANYTVKLYNIYNNVVDYAYVSKPLTAGFHGGSSIDVNGEPWTIDIPFYTLTGFDVAVYESSKTITVKPHYDTVNTVSVNVINGSATGNKLTDNSAVKSSSVYISTEADNFYAWANVKGDKYQIISYNKDYGYAAISDGNYTPVVKENGTYYVYTSDSEKTELKASMIDQFKNNSDYKLSDNDYLFTKLNNYAPFTYIEDDSQSADGKYRVFIRVTSGSNDDYKKAFDSFGVYGYGSKIPFTTVNEISGQYTFTSSVLPSDFNAYVSYKMTYTDKTGSYNITTTDFAKNA